MVVYPYHAYTILSLLQMFIKYLSYSLDYNLLIKGLYFSTFVTLN